LVNCIFSSCSATFGGAIFSESEEPSGRIFEEVSFIDNTVADGGNGNDIADISTIGVNFYSPLTVKNCVSTSTTSFSVSNFFLLQLSVIFDCLFSPEGCSVGIFYVSTKGIDSYVCGQESSPCKSLAQSIYDRSVSVGENAVILVASGEYTHTYMSVSYSNLSILTTSETSELKPVLSLLTPPPGLFCDDCRRFIILLFFISFVKVLHQLWQLAPMDSLL
jgi:hypothetical protein